jgi:hypothetical protein
VSGGDLAHDPALDHDRKMTTYFDHEKLEVYQQAIDFSRLHERAGEYGTLAEREQEHDYEHEQDHPR